MVQALSNAEVDVDALDDDRNTALIWASKAGHVDVVCLLVDAGACINVVGSSGETALMAAQREGHAEIVELLEKAGPAEERRESFLNWLYRRNFVLWRIQSGWEDWEAQSTLETTASKKAKCETTASGDLAVCLLDSRLVGNLWPGEYVFCDRLSRIVTFFL